MKKFNTVQEYVDFIESPKTDYMNITNDLVDISKSSFWVAGNIHNLPSVSKLLEQEPQIKNSDLSRETMTESEIKYHIDHNFGSGYDRHKPDSLLIKVASLLGFENPSVWVNNQPPGAMMARHVDTIMCFLHEKGNEVKSMSFDNELRQPKFSKPIYRCFVALDDWHPGQIVNFEPSFWTEWKKGDIVFFDWRNTPHSTANTGSHNRPFLKITGTLSDSEWVEEAKLSSVKKEFFYDSI